MRGTDCTTKARALSEISRESNRLFSTPRSESRKCPSFQSRLRKGGDRQGNQFRVGQNSLGAEEFAASLGELAAVRFVGLQRGAVEPEDRAGILPAYRKLDVFRIVEVVPDGGGGELGSQAHGPASGVGEAEQLGSQLAARFAQEQLGWLEQGGVQGPVAVAGKQREKAALHLVAPPEGLAAQIRHSSQPRDWSGCFCSLPVHSVSVWNFRQHSTIPDGNFTTECTESAEVFHIDFSVSFASSVAKSAVAGPCCRYGWALRPPST